MRVLHLTDRLSARGGADLHLLGLLAELGRDCDLLLAVGRDDGTAAPPCQLAKIPGLGEKARASVAAQLDEVARAFAPSVIHIHNSVNPAALEWAAERGAVATVHDHRCFCPGRGKLTMDGAVCRDPMSPSLCAGCFADEAYARAIYARTEERLRAVERMARIHVLSRYMRDELVATGVPAERVVVVPPFVRGLDPEAAPNGPPCVLFAGRLVTAKGVHDAAEAWRRSEVDLPLVFAGTGAERNRLETQGFDMLGWVPHEQMSAIYRRAEVVIMPSRWQEPFGITGLEALAMRVPVAAWQSGGIREWLPKTAAEWGDVDGLARALRDAVGAGASEPEGFERDRLMSQLRQLYRAASA